MSVCLVALLTGTFSSYYLKAEIERQFQFALQRAEGMKSLAADAVARSIENQPDLPVAEALAKDSDLAGRLAQIMTVSGSLIEITICDPKDNKVLVSTDPSRRMGDSFPDYPDYSQLATKSGLFEKVQVLRAKSPKFYQLFEALGTEGQSPVVLVRVVILPGLIRDDILPELQKAIVISLLAIIGSILSALVFSNFAFQPLSNVTKMLDHLTRGEYESQAQDSRFPAKEDEFGAMVSKVNLLGQQLGNFERLLDQLEEAVLVFGANRSLIVASGALEKFLGKRRLELMGLTMTDIFPPDASVGFFLEQILETGRPVRNFPVRLGSVDGEGRNGSDSKPKLSHALLSVELLESFASGARKNAGIMVRLRDPEVRRQIKGQLQTAERLTAINRVTSGVAHEVKNPLNAMLMHVELARIKLAKGDTDVSPQMEIIASEILRLDRVVKTFLDFTRPVEMKTAEVAVDGFVSELAELARPQAQAVGVTVSAGLHAPGVTMVVDSDLLKQAALNIVVNAIEAMQQGGELRFESSVEGEEVEIRISDSGPGIPPDKREKIFQLYFTTKKKGSGIGLAMTFRIVQLHNGKIDFFSEPGKGTTFMLRFPVEGAPQ